LTKNKNQLAYCIPRSSGNYLAGLNGATGKFMGSNISLGIYMRLAGHVHSLLNFNGAPYYGEIAVVAGQIGHVFSERMATAGTDGYANPANRTQYSNNFENSAVHQAGLQTEGRIVTSMLGSKPSGMSIFFESH